MTEPTTEELIKKHLETLTKPVKDAINSFDWAREVYDVCHKRSMHIDDIGEIQNEVMLVVLGIAAPRDFYNQMVSRLRIPEDEALDIADEVNTRVFLRIREFMKNYYAEEEKKGKEIVGSERQVLRDSGIKLGDEPEGPETVAPDNSKSEEKYINLPPIAGVGVSDKAKETVVEASPTISENLQKSAVFKNPPPNYFDPYREPIE